MTARTSIIARMRFVGVALMFVLAASGPPALAQQPSGAPADFPAAQAAPPEAASADDAVAEGPANRSAPGLPTDLVGIATALDYWLIPFVLATLIALWFSAERLVVLRRGRVIPKPFVDRFLKHLEDGTISRDEALEVCEENGSPVAMVFAHGVRKWGKPSVEVEQAIIDGGERQVSQLRSHLRVINGVATVTPLLGLLGTVWGMLEAFNDIAIAGSMGNTTVLASGIALALLTTAAGLVIAIPSLIIYMYLSGRVDSLVMDMDELSQNIVQTVSAEALSDKRPRTTTPPRKKAAS